VNATSRSALRYDLRVERCSTVRWTRQPERKFDQLDAKLDVIEGGPEQRRGPGIVSTGLVAQVPLALQVCELPLWLRQAGAEAKMARGMGFAPQSA
jgi:hypothetical protein